MAGRYALKVTMLAVFFCLFLLDRSAHADRFVENFVRRPTALSDERLRLIASTYLKVAQNERARRKNYSADHFARRAMYYYSVKRLLKAPEFDLRGPLISEEHKQLIDATYRKANLAIECSADDNSTLEQIRISIAYEKLALYVVQGANRRTINGAKRVVDRLVERHLVIENCRAFADIREASTEIDWNVPLPASISDREPKVSNQIDRIAAGGRPVFGRKVDPWGGPHMTCNVDPGQRTVYFAIDGTQLIDNAALEVVFAAAAAAGPFGQVTVEGHADAAGPEAHNSQLARKRAEAVAAMLINGGVDTNLISIRSVGANCPQRQGLGGIFVAANRRVTIKMNRVHLR